MKILAAVIAMGALATAAGAAERAPALGIDANAKRLAWYDTVSLKQVGARKARAWTAGSWSFSPQRARLAVSDDSGSIGLYDVKRMRSLGNLDAATLGQLHGLSWLRADRLLAVKTIEATSMLSVIDPLKKRVVRRIDLPGLASHRTIVGDRAVFLVIADGSFRPAQVAVIDADGTVRTAAVDRISAGMIVDRDSNDPSARTRTPGFAVDVAGHRAFVVSPDLLVAEVNLDTLAIAYHGPARTLAKSINGPERNAVWLGNGLLAVAGADFVTVDNKTTITPYGLRVIDTRTWTARTVDADATYVEQGPGVLVTSHDGAWIVWGIDGTERYRVTLPRNHWFTVQGPYGYVCNGRSLVRVVDAATGAKIAAPKGRGCVTLLLGRSSDW